MIIVGLLCFGLLGIAAYGALIVVGALTYAPFYWGYRLVRFIVRMAWRIVVGVLRFARFVAMAFVHVGGDLARLAR